MPRAARNIRGKEVVWGGSYVHLLMRNHETSPDFVAFIPIEPLEALDPAFAFKKGRLNDDYRLPKGLGSRNGTLTRSFGQDFLCKEKRLQRWRSGLTRRSGKPVSSRRHEFESRSLRPTNWLENTKMKTLGLFIILFFFSGFAHASLVTNTDMILFYDFEKSDLIVKPFHPIQSYSLQSDVKKDGKKWIHSIDADFDNGAETRLQIVEHRDTIVEGGEKYKRKSFVVKKIQYDGETKKAGWKYELVVKTLGKKTIQRYKVDDDTRMLVKYDPAKDVSMVYKKIGKKLTLQEIFPGWVTLLVNTQSGYMDAFVDTDE